MTRGGADEETATIAAVTPRPPATLYGTPRLRRQMAFWLPPVIAAEGFVLYVEALLLKAGPYAGVDLYRIGGLGLISALPAAAFIGLFMLVGAFFVTLAQRRHRRALLLSELVAITICLHGAAALVERHPRFPTAWLIGGFVDYIGRTGEALPGFDARFSWPGFFAAAAFVTRALGVEDLGPILTWTPLVSNLLYLVPLLLLLRVMRADPRAKWLAALLFVVAQWVGQDYFSPQGLTYLLYLAFAAIVVAWFARLTGGRRGQRMTPGELEPAPVPARERVLLLALLVAVFVTATVSHQITPFMMLGALTGLILVRRTTLSLALPFLLGVIVVAWVSYAATPFWSGHLDTLFGGIGRLGRTLAESTGGRIAGSSPEHVTVLRIRLGICAAVALLAFAGLVRRLRRRVLDRTALVLMCVPAIAVALQSYGGEIGLRVYLFALPGACLLAAYAFFPGTPGAAPRAGRPRRNPVAVGLALACVSALTLAFFVARYGNEKFELVTDDEAAALEFIYANDLPSARVAVLSPVAGEEAASIPIRSRDIELVDYRPFQAPRDPSQIAPLVERLRELGPNSYLLTTRSQEAYLELAHGYAPTWGRDIRAVLSASPELAVAFENRDAAIYTMRRPPPGPVPPPPDNSVTTPTTRWTPYGLTALALLVLVLGAIEVRRVLARPVRRRVVVLAAVLFAAAIAVVVERFLTIGGLL
ncbi:hypothetical protein [Bailinhaonella thermotolerans]|uniref:Glycosyltransferase RgtA/B/C/D-like domain-containing protein n=1 Tax=Bailinhaonella thermotolerans TaxID=1070861 RepID=A0A3A4ATE9_9ACTN|nr:hypothetical protein [Bailinhaonella thermotolerans]RJL32653.1 hypothetical protein D5H75_14210 [Bailinhaonella thermotolerans]